MANILNRRKGKMAVEYLIGIFLILIALFFFISIAVTGKEAFSSEALNSYSCWATNGIKNAMPGKVTPSSCTMQIIDEPVDLEKFTSLLRRAWWMYGRGKWDIGNSYHLYPVYTLKFKEEIPVGNFFDYILNHNKGETVTDPRNSEFNYFEQDAPYLTFCIQQKSVEGGKFKKDTPYYISFYDDTGKQVVGDKILISDEPNFVKDEAKEIIEKTPLVSGIWGWVHEAAVQELASITFWFDEDLRYSGCLRYGITGLQETESK